MVSCKKCIHYAVCADFYDDEIERTAPCSFFKDRSLFVELPCSTSETLFVIEDSGEIIIDKVETIVTIGYDEDFSQSRLDCYSGKHYYVKDIGKTVFFTREEAEKALKEREIND